MLAVRTLRESAPAARRGTATSHLKECLGRGGEGRGGVLLYVVPSDISKARCCGGDEMEKKQKKKVGAAFQRCPRLRRGGTKNKTGSNGERRRAKRRKHVIVSPGRSDTNRPLPVALEALARQVMLRCRCMQSHEPMLIWVGGGDAGGGGGSFCRRKKKRKELHGCSVC